jgi:hypothetical protein
MCYMLNRLKHLVLYKKDYTLLEILIVMVVLPQFAGFVLFVVLTMFLIVWNLIFRVS